MTPRSSDPVVLWTFRSCAALAPPLALLAPLGFAPLLVVLGVVLLAATARTRPWRRLPMPLAALLAAVAVWGAVTAPFAVDPSHSLRVAATFLGQTAAGLVLCLAAAELAAAEARRLLLVLAASAAACAAFLGFEIATCGAVAGLVKDVSDFCGTQRYVYKRGATVLLLLAVPTLAVLLAERRLLLAAALAGLVAATAWLGSGTVLAALGASAAAGLAARLGGARAVKAMGAALAVAVLAAPFAARQLPDPLATYHAVPGMPHSVHHRLTIWDFTADRWADKPLAGWGMDSSRSIPGGDGRFVATFGGPDKASLVHLAEQLMPLHPHNFILQWWVELGAVGGMLLAALAWTVAVLVAGAGARATASAVTAAVVVVSAASFGAWQSWWLSAVWVLAGLAILAGRARPHGNTTSDRVEESPADRAAAKG